VVLQHGLRNLTREIHALYDVVAALGMDLDNFEFQLGDAAVRVPEWNIEQIVSPACPGVKPSPAYRFTVEYLLIYTPEAYLLAAMEILKAFLIAGRTEFSLYHGIDIFDIAMTVDDIHAIAHGVEDVFQIVDGVFRYMFRSPLHISLFLERA
jgi:hypothetical protein